MEALLAQADATPVLTAVARDSQRFPDPFYRDLCARLLAGHVDRPMATTDFYRILIEKSGAIQDWEEICDEWEGTCSACWGDTIGITRWSEERMCLYVEDNCKECDNLDEHPAN